MHRVIIVGGGYGGLTVAQTLLQQLPDEVELFLVDRMPYQGLKTEYYALAAGTVSDLELRVAFPTHPQCKLVYGEITALDLMERCVHITGHEPLSYDSLVIALGCTDKHHGIPGAKEHTFGIQTLSATRRAYQAINDVRPYGQATIIGGGLSGVEIAAELRESRADLNIQIIDRGNGILSAFPQTLQTYVADWFRQHDVRMYGHITTQSITPGAIHYDDGRNNFATDVIVWTAGIQPVELVQQLQLPKDPQERLIINEYHELPDYPGVYVIGDCASMPFSPSAQLAAAQGKQVAAVLQSRWQGKTPDLGRIKLKGVLGSLGSKAGFGLMGRTPLLGRIPRVLKSGVLWRSKRHFG